MNLILATKDNLAKILDIIKDAQALLKENGINQWQNGYPNAADILDDINLKNGYIIINEQEIIGYCVIDYRGDSNYDIIYEGQFHNQHPYATIHRFTIKREFQGRGLALKFFKLIDQFVINNGFDTIRIDTHKDNQRMLKLVSKAGYQYCGIVKLNRTHDRRLAFDKILI